MTERIVSYLITVGGFGVLIYLMKKWLTRIETKLDDMEKNYFNCREELPKRFAARKDTKKQFSELWSRTDEHEKDIAYAKGLRNGQGQNA